MQCWNLFISILLSTKWMKFAGHYNLLHRLLFVHMAMLQNCMAIKIFGIKFLGWKLFGDKIPTKTVSILQSVCVCPWRRTQSLGVMCAMTLWPYIIGRYTCLSTNGFSPNFYLGNTLRCSPIHFGASMWDSVGAILPDGLSVMSGFKLLDFLVRDVHRTCKLTSSS